MKLALYILIIFSLVTGSCSSRKTKLDSNNLIPEKELISLLIDIHIADGLLAIPGIYNKYIALDSINTYYNIIEKHGYTKEMMDKTMKYYFIKNPLKLNKIYDEVLGKLSEMETYVEKESYFENAKISNIWNGKDFYAIPSTGNNDTAEINLKLPNPGLYILSFSVTVYPDDQTVNPCFTAYSVSADSLDQGKRKYYKTPEYIKDGMPHLYVLNIKVSQKSVLHFGGTFFDSNYNPDVIDCHYEIENISFILSYVL